MLKTQPTHVTFDRKEFDRMAAEWRYVMTDMICRAGSGHLGGALSLTEVVITLYYRIMRVDPQRPRWDERDRLVLSKGHARRSCTWRWPTWASSRRRG